MLIDKESCPVQRSVVSVFGMFVYNPQACPHVWGADYHSSEIEALNLPCVAISHYSTLLNLASSSLPTFTF